MVGKILDNGTLLALGLVGVVAAAGAASKAGLYGSRNGGKRDIQSWLQARVRALPLPPDANVRVLHATLQSYVLDGVPQEAVEYELGAHTNLNYDSTLSSYHEADLHDIVTRALDVDNVRIEDDSVDRHPDDGHSVVWSGTVYADGDALSRRVNRYWGRT